MGDSLALPMVSSTMGAMNSVLQKLTALEAEHPTISEGLRGDLMNLNDVLHNFARRSVRHAIINEWMLQAREVIYDVEDWFDGILTRPAFASEPAAMDIFCSDVEEQIQEFKAQIEDVQDLCKRYNLLNIEAAAPVDISVADNDPAPSSEVISITIQANKQLHGMVPYLETVERQRKMILNHHLMRGEECHRKVVCIMGTRGVGKTTLATKIYRDLLGEYDCGAFVHLGHNTSVNKTLASILQQVNPMWRNEIDSGDNNYCTIGPEEKEVIAALWETLKKRSYFVVLDDVRSTWTWKRISCALPNNHQSVGRILVTTCVEDVAELCCIHPRDAVHHMQNLTDDDSKTLFDSKVPFSENKSLQPAFHELLKICGGIPLAISFAAGLLLFRKYACLPLTSLMLDQYQSTPQGMRKILEISYFDLPQPLKSCFLYLSTFPENNAIKKDRLIRRWIAEGFVPRMDKRFWETGEEGFVPKGDGERLWKTGESYFSELICRRLIQPLFDDEDDQPIGCTVHGAVLDFLISLSTEENFITAGSEPKLELLPFAWVRRLCFECSAEGEGNTLSQGTYSCVASSSSQISCSNEDQEDSWNRLHLSRVRSLLFSGNAGRMPDVGAMKFVRVLDLEDTKGMTNKQLDSIGCLSLLKYLGLGGTDVTKLPQQIMALEQLTTLDLRRTRVRKIPAFTNTKLISLLADALTVPRRIGAMQNLEELSKVLLGDDGSLASEVQELVKEFKKLRMLGVRFGRLNDQNDKHREGVRDFLIELGKSESELQSIFLDNCLHCLLDILVESWSHKSPRYLRKFDLRMTRRPWLSEIPQDMASIIALTHLHIGVSELQEPGVRALGGLPNLLLLKLSSDTRPRMILITMLDGFPRLKVFWYDCEYGGIQFQKGAMPELERLRLVLNVQGKMGDFDFGMEHLSCLIQVRAIINCKDNSTASEVESDIRRQVSQNRNNPVFDFNRRGQQYSSVKAARGSVIEIHSADEWFAHIDHEKLVVVHFTAAWCGPSNMIAPFLVDLAKKNPDVIFLKVDVDEVRTIAEQFHVVIDSSYTVPTFMFMREGDDQVRVVGANKEELQETLDLQKVLWSTSTPTFC